MTYPPPYVVESKDGHSHTVILLHGRSSTAQEFANDLFALRSSKQSDLPSHLPGVRWVFPDAGQLYCTTFREERSAWCDTFCLEDLSRRQDLQVAGLRNGIRMVQKLIEEEVERLAGEAGRIILGGFSQGSATALWSLFTGAAVVDGKLGGFVGLSAWMPFTREAQAAVGKKGPIKSRFECLQDTFLEIVGLNAFIGSVSLYESLEKIPVFLGHGIDDVPVNVSHCHDLSMLFQNLEMLSQKQLYSGARRDGHWVKEPEQIDDVIDFLQGVMREG
ncbi:alpha/beta-hydrolase [Polyplosphaeria fusca]|uniref:Alpha/beta-hydrolase n=1 Tax=Polyplosphaeria fusca TaxID=682080 RepID=A0A9P4RCL5_9PLEO|nr:alpha/beta-hydrolase [Polyplosphaeria fusca]